MINKTILSLIFLTYSMSLFAHDFPQPLSSRIANYDIDVRLDVKEKKLYATERLTWHNQTGDTIRTMPFHLYYNAFKNTASTFMQEAGGNLFGMKSKDIDGEAWGWSEMTSVIVDSVDLTEKLNYIHPDDDNYKDRTVVELTLDKPILPNDSIVLNIVFEAKVPKLMVRTGYSKDDYFFMVQWFPKVGVYEQAGQRFATTGQWNCHQYHAASEYFADFGVYNVNITVPDNLEVGASGYLKEVKKNDDKTHTFSYRAEDVIDFAWTASSLFEEVLDSFDHTSIRLLIQPEHKQFAPRYLKSIKAAMAYFKEHVASYPYPTLTIVDPPARGLQSSGMEYPTLITVGSVYGLPNGLRFVETIAIHEFAHQFFMQMVATNEMEEAWMDEGFVAYMEDRIMDETYGKKSSSVDMLGFGMGDREWSRIRYNGLSNRSVNEIARFPWKFDGSYHTITYSKMAIVLATLEGLVGLDVMDEILQTYFERWKFKHPTERDFIAVVDEVTRKHSGVINDNWDWFFEQTLHGTSICDYALADISNKKIQKPFGLFGEGKERHRVQFREKSDNMIASRVTVHRLGDMQMPIEVEIVFSNGEKVLEKWDGKDRVKKFEYTRAETIVSAQIDPKQKILLDIDLNNNSLTKKPSQAPIGKYAAKMMFWLQNTMQTIAFFS